MYSRVNNKSIPEEEKRHFFEVRESMKGEKKDYQIFLTLKRSFRLLLEE